MTIIIDKKAVLQDFVKKYVLGQWQEELLRINQRYGQDKETIENKLIAAFDQVCKRTSELQKQEKKRDTRYINISFLRTSIMDNTSYYRIDTYDENWYLDQEECSSLWDADFIFRSLFQHMADLETKKSRCSRKITSIDIDRIKMFEALKYHVLAVEFIREMLPRLLATEGYTQMQKSPEINILAGEYMDHSEILYGKNPDSDPNPEAKT